MPASPSLPTVTQLRRLLAERFPQATRPETAGLSTGVAALDEAMPGGIPFGAVTEIVAAAPSTGGQLLQSRLLEQIRQTRRFAALIDAADAFDPESHDNSLLAHLLWVRCNGAPQALQAADLLIRDGNLALILFDLRGCPPQTLRRTPATTWFRFQRVVEQSETALVVFTERAQILSAQVRLCLETTFTLAAGDESRDALTAGLTVRIERNRFAGARPPLSAAMDEDACRAMARAG